MSAACAVFLAALGLAGIVHAQDCPKPEGGANMVLSGGVTFPVPDGTKVTFKCETGYTAGGGSGSITCSNGAWSPLTMSCSKKNCGSPGEVSNGQINYDEGTEFGAKIIVTCDPGYRLVGQNELICGDQGWLGRLPECEVVMCEPPPLITNGDFEPLKDAYEYLEVIQYSCQGDHVLNGSRTLTCSDNGAFKPAPPKCILVQCKDPDIENGQWASGSRPPYKHMSSVTLKCHRGFSMTGTGTVTCGLNSQWAPRLPVCTATECKAPEVKDGEVIGGSRPSYKYLETVTIKCKTGFEINGQSTLTCSDSSEWSPSPPKCTAIKCKAPEVKDGMLVDGSRPSYKYLDSVTFECKSGYKMNGQNTLTCSLDSQWSPAPPECTPISTTNKTTKTTSAPPINLGNDGHRTTTIVLSVLSVLGAIGIGICIACGVLKKKKRTKNSCSEAAHEAETVTLS